MKYLPDEIIKEWGLTSFSPEEQIEMVEKLNKILYQLILGEAIELLPENEQDELDLFAERESTTPEMILAFLASKIPNFEQIRLNKINEVKSLVLSQ